MNYVQNLIRAAADFVNAVRAEQSKWNVTLPFRRATEADRALAIATARERIANMKRQTFAGYQLAAVANAVAFDEAMIVRLERGDAFTVPQ